MIDIHSERLVPLDEYARLRPPGRNGKPMHKSTAHRHAHKGVRGVRLETVRIGGTLYTSREAIQRFVERLSDPSSAPTSPHSMTASRRAAEVAAEEAARILGR